MICPVEFLLENIQVQNNVIRAAHQAGVRKLRVPGEFLHLPETRAATDPGSGASDRAARTNQ